MLQSCLGKTLKSCNLTSDNENIKKLITHLCEQIELDSEFRNCKKWFSKLQNQNDKWMKLGLILKRQYHFNTSNQHNVDIFDLNEEEDNPFLTIRDSEGSY